MGAATVSSSSGSGIALQLPLPPPLQPIRSQPQQPQQPQQQKPREPIRTQPSPVPRPPGLLPYRQAQILRQPEHPLPKDPNSVTMNMIIDQILVPSFLAKEAHRAYAPAAIKRKYVTQMKERHAKLALRIENWRQNVPCGVGDEALLSERRDRVYADDFSWTLKGRTVEGAGQRAMMGQWRESQDRKNVADFINGRVEGVEKGRLMCWYVLIPAKATKVWYQADKGFEWAERAYKLKWTRSVEELAGLPRLVDGEGPEDEFYDDLVR
ncbi:MAG: hypothetical protein Q9225_006209 [Loekoesia sp. 1 TL-2023]